MTTPQFGQAEPGATYPDRPAAFAVIEREGLIALVRVERQGRGLVLDLPGGGIDEGETAAEAAVRECGEEAGLVVALDAEPFVQADHYFLHNDGAVRNTRGAFFVGRVLAEDPALKIEDDHERVWIAPEEALLRLDRESHVWAVVTWLRLRPRA
jgi:8-oxo-dGTP diphosphatase